MVGLKTEGLVESLCKEQVVYQMSSPQAQATGLPLSSQNTTLQESIWWLPIKIDPPLFTSPGNKVPTTALLPILPLSLSATHSLSLSLSLSLSHTHTHTHTPLPISTLKYRQLAKESLKYCRLTQRKEGRRGGRKGGRKKRREGKREKNTFKKRKKEKRRKEERRGRKEGREIGRAHV